MESFKTKLTAFLLCLLTINPLFIYRQGLRIKIAGDEKEAFRADIYNGNQLRFICMEEFSLQLFNPDLNTTISRVVLSMRCFLLPVLLPPATSPIPNMESPHTRIIIALNLK